MSRFILLAIAGLFAWVPAAAAQESPFEHRTPHTLTAASGVPSPRATLQDMGWLAGRWTGAALGGVTEECWSGPAGGAMMGMVEHEGSLLIRLKHFNADLTGWEKKADTVKFRLLKIAADTAHFDGMTFHRLSDESLEVFLAIRNRADSSVREERFVMQRSAGL